jgi:hypothetical protein
MVDVKDIRVERIDSKSAIAFVKRWHYSGKVATNSQLHFGAFHGGKLHGVLSFGPPLDRSKVIGLVEGTVWNDMVELNRMAFDEYLPRNSESRVIAVCLRLLKKHCPHVRWVLSFSDGTQCGDGTIYRATGFVLTAIKRNDNTIRLPDGSVIHKMTLESAPTLARPELAGRSYYEITGGAIQFASLRKSGGRGSSSRLPTSLHLPPRQNRPPDGARAALRQD